MPAINTENAPYIFRSCLRKEAAKAVKSVKDNLDTIWQRLDEIYGDPAKVMDVIMNTIQNTRVLREGKNKKIIDFINIIEDGYGDLQR